MGSRIWLALWSSDVNTTNDERDIYLGVYGAFGFFQAFFVLVSSIFLAFGSIRASRSLHDSLIINILHSPMSFFETTPIGRIVNRFSKDLYTIDDAIPRSMGMFLRTFLGVMGTLFAISYATPLFLTILIPLGIVYFLIQVSKNLYYNDTYFVCVRNVPYRAAGLMYWMRYAFVLFDWFRWKSI